MKNASGMQWTLLLEGDVFYLTMTNSENSTTNLHRHIKRLIGSVYSECEGSWKPPLVEICRTESVCVCVCVRALSDNYRKDMLYQTEDSRCNPPPLVYRVWFSFPQPVHSDGEKRLRRANPPRPWLKLTPLVCFCERATIPSHTVDGNCHLRFGLIDSSWTSSLSVLVTIYCAVMCHSFYDPSLVLAYHYTSCCYEDKQQQQQFLSFTATEKWTITKYRTQA